MTRLNDDSTNLLGSGNVPMVVLGIDLRIRRFTPAAGKVLNLHSADVGRPIGDLRLAVDVPDLEPMLSDVIASVQIKEREVRDRDGRWYALRIHPYRTANHKIDGAVMVLADIDEVKRALVRIEEAGDYARAIVETVREPLVILTADLRANSANRSFYQTFQVAPEETENQFLYDLGGWRSDAPPLRSLLKDILQSGLALDDFEVEHEIPGLGRRTMLLNARRLVQREGATQRILLAFEDVTERRRAEQELRESQQALEEADRRKNEFLAMLAHELRNPLAAISSAVQVSNQAGADAATAAWSKEIVERQIKNLARLIDDLLDISRVTQGKVQLRKEPVDIGPIVARAVEVVRPHIDVRKHELSISLPEEPVRLLADPTRLEQVLVNLLSNAAKFTDPGGRIWLEVREQGNESIITVGDTGVGISPEMLPRVFDLFTQVERSSDRSQGGLGIGLTLVRSLVEMHDGSVSVSSTPARGASSPCGCRSAWRRLKIKNATSRRRPRRRRHSRAAF